MSKKTYYQQNRNVILNRAKYYYENNKERLRENARDKYRNLSEEENNKKREYGRSKYHNMSKEKKQKLKEYQKSYCATKISKFLTFFSFHSIKMEQEGLYFGEYGIINNAF